MMKQLTVCEFIMSINMEFLLSSSVLFTTSFILILFSFIYSHVFRINKDDSLKKDVNKKMTSESNNTNFDAKEDRDEPLSGLTFKFQYQFEQSPLATSIHKYQFIGEKNVSGFVKEPQVQFCRVEESEIGKGNELDINCSSGEDSSFKGWGETVYQPSLNKGIESPRSETLEEAMQLKGISTLARFLSDEFSGLSSDPDSISVSDGYSVKDIVIDSDGILSQEDADELEHKSVTSEESTTSTTYKLDLQDATLQYISDSDTEFPDFELGSKVEQAESSEIRNSGVAQTHAFDIIKIELIDSSDDELLHSTLDRFSSQESSVKVLSEEDVVDRQDRKETLDRKEEQIVPENFDFFDDNNSQTLNTNLNKASERSELLTVQKELDGYVLELDKTKEMTDKENETSETNHMKKSFEDDDDFDSLWEHEDLIEQLKMEIKRSRTNGLPTILEESESPKSVEDLKPFKIESKFVPDDPIDELHKFHKSYIERMKKLDTLNNQKMYAIGFHQLKEPLELLGSQKFCIPSITSIMSQNCPLRRRNGINPSESFLKELRCDLELVYVAQMCLSWEFLRWQYEKARELSESDARRNRQYNQVAGEFQKFQVLIQRFIENESFQGPRLHNYVRNRCVCQNLLQVPVVKEDSLKDKKEERQKDNFIITSEMLEDIMEESIRIFWKFVKADKDETPSFLKGLMGQNVELQDPSDYELLTNIQSELQKKEKRLSDILRTGNCLVKKFKKPKEDRSNQDIFFSQIDLKLIARVVRMPRITSEQLVWCQQKLSKIIIVKERKIHREASFFLFPC